MFTIKQARFLILPLLLLLISCNTTPPTNPPANPLPTTAATLPPIPTLPPPAASTKVATTVPTNPTADATTVATEIPSTAVPTMPPTTNEMQDLTGKWKFIKYLYGSTAALSPDEAANWLNYIVEIKEDNGNEILLLDNLECYLTTKTEEDAVRYLDEQYRTHPYQIGISSPTIDIIESDCEIPGFSTFIQDNDQLFVIIENVFFALQPVLPAATGPNNCINEASWIADQTLIHGTVVEAGKSFSKQWKIQNAGSCAWNTQYQVAFSSGDQAAGPDSIAINGVMEPDFEYTVWIDFVAPATPGVYHGFWQLYSPSGEAFGPALDYLIQVPAP